MMIFWILLLIYVGVVFTAISMYTVAWYDYVNFRCKADDPAWRRKIKAGAMLSAVFLESLAMLFHLLTRPLRLIFDRRQTEYKPDGGAPILLIHGFASSSHAFLLISRFLKRKGFKNIYTMTYRPVMADMPTLAQKVAGRIDEVLEQSGADKVVLIAHSMGGPLTRYAIKNLDMMEKVRQVITLGGAHMGTRTASLMPRGRNTLELTYRSDFLKALAEGGLTPGNSIGYVSIYSVFDQYIIPQDAADLGPGASNQRLQWHGHVRLLYSRKVNRMIERALLAESSGQ